jgi:hypothetical protein
MKAKIIKKEKQEPMFRLNTRIRNDQSDFVKAESAKLNLSEGEMFRSMLDFYIKNNK